MQVKYIKVFGFNGVFLCGGLGGWGRGDGSIQLRHRMSLQHPSSAREGGEDPPFARKEREGEDRPK